ncbi:protein of unknown function [Burkholderia multivorans]
MSSVPVVATVLSAGRRVHRKAVPLRPAFAAIAQALAGWPLHSRGRLRFRQYARLNIYIFNASLISQDRDSGK